MRYRTYNSTTGWTGWAVGGQQTSFDGNAWYPVEAIQYRFAGPVNDQYDIYYCAQLSDGTEDRLGKNGETVGTMNTGPPFNRFPPLHSSQRIPHPA